MLKVLNDFDELIADLETAAKKEKKQDYKDFISRIKDNIVLWKVRYDSFITAAGKKTKKEDK